VPKIDRLHELRFVHKMELPASVKEKKEVFFIWRMLPDVMSSENNKIIKTRKMVLEKTGHL
jgi:hypothetical protein